MDSPSISEKIVSLLRCPVSGQGLHLGSPDQFKEFPGEFLEGGLVSEDGNILYPIRNGFPLVVPSERVNRRVPED